MFPGVLGVCHCPDCGCGKGKAVAAAGLTHPVWGHCFAAPVQPQHFSSDALLHLNTADSTLVFLKPEQEPLEIPPPPSNAPTVAFGCRCAAPATWGQRGKVYPVLLPRQSSGCAQLHGHRRRAIPGSSPLCHCVLCHLLQHLPSAQGPSAPMSRAHGDAPRQGPGATS